ncbi:MAG: enoyl-CoA hydratase/isomerase family protein [Bryobacterales bacterium]|nr:enoyl-CoA hydratase/isomerase family protein [Bryobacterales bacterium]
MSHLLITREERVLRLTLNNPDARNPLDEAICHELVAALLDAGKDRTVGCVLLDASGPVFCSGLEMNELLMPNGPELGDVHEELLTFGVHYHKPIVAAVQGAVAGAGIGLIANCHVVLAAQGVQFGLTEIRVGHWPFVAHRAVALAIGERRAVELSLTGRVFGTGDAQQYGLVHEVVPPFELDDRATATARQLANASQETLRRGLDFVQKSREMSWATAGRLAVEYTDRTVRSADLREGIHANREKRKPDWPSLH